MIKGSRIIDPLVVFMIGAAIFWVIPEAIRIHFFETWQVEEVYAYLAVSAAVVALSYAAFVALLKRTASDVAGEAPAEAMRLFATTSIVLLTPICVALAAVFVAMRWSADYGEGDTMPYVFQIFLYSHLYLLFFYLRFVDEQEVKSRRFLLLSLAVVLPRLLISTHWGRFFVGQAVLPLVFAALVGGGIMVKGRHILLIVAGAALIYFALPMLRGDDVVTGGSDSLLKFVAAGGPVSLVGQVEDVGRAFPNVDFLKTGLIGPFAPDLLNPDERIDIWGQEGAPLTLDRAFAALEGIGFYSLTGPGSVYVADLLVLGGFVALMAGSIVIGGFLALTRFLYRLNPLFSLALFDIVSKTVFLPRTSFTYLIDRIVVLTLICALMLKAARWCRRHGNG
ncbi:hypothetical protein AWB79_06885 [Caballeronia hypogeia]|uniref:Uncharacterized protein n=1 Tax=Caballeronia hypogeia TaxID=1777140 RepID=A0A158DEC3_9BURK|nr:hypothetical protein [Caballeronia hypogeia]SAK92954.1 hypothetical protein AWB79_06885 [Caballeronia hypogeia]